MRPLSVAVLLLVAMAMQAAHAHAQAQAHTHATTTWLKGVVTHVSDGDTVWLRPDGNAQARPLKLRLRGIDAPERCQAGGHAATVALAGRVKSVEVVVRVVGTDTYGRLIGDMSRHGDDVGAWMVREGHAWSHRRPGVASTYAKEEREARAARRGLFSDPQAIEPSVFRKRHGPCA